MNNNILKSVMQTIADRRYSAELSARKNYETALKDARFFSIASRITSLQRLIAKAEIDKNISERDKLMDEYGKLSKEKGEILHRFGMKEDSFTPHFKCNLCNDTGYVGNTLCRCAKMLINEKMMAENGIDIKSLNTFKDFNVSKFPLNAQQYLSKCQRHFIKYTADFYNNSKNILLFGNAGTGKTFLINAIATALHQRGFIVSYNTSFAFNNCVLQYHTTFDDNKQYLIETFTNADVLIIDDLGTEPILKNVTVEYLYSIINDRYIKNKPTIISSNLNITGLITRYGERTISRLIDKNRCQTFNFDFDNLRVNK